MLRRRCTGRWSATVRSMTLETSQVLDGARLAPLSTSERLTRASKCRACGLRSVRYAAAAARYPGACEWRLSRTASPLC